MNSMGAYRYFVAEKRDDTLIAQLIDSHLQGDMVAEQLKQELLQAVDAESPKMVVIDLRNVDIISTMVISTFLYANSRLGASGIKFKLTELSQPLRQIFRELHLDGAILQIYESIDEALTKETSSEADGTDRPARFDPEEDDE
tara:strand:+ start:282 stop:710 length:429 start_codon:yes stop_codon:yes gene_type:complete